MLLNRATRHKYLLTYRYLLAILLFTIYYIAFFDLSLLLTSHEPMFTFFAMVSGIPFSNTLLLITAIVAK